VQTYFEVLTQLLHILLDTKYNTPTVFRLADYSTVLQESGVTLPLWHLYTPFHANDQTKYIPIAQTSMIDLAVIAEAPTSLQLTDWLCCASFDYHINLMMLLLPREALCFRNGYRVIVLLGFYGGRSVNRGVV
jgi:hypothetical protein